MKGLKFLALSLTLIFCLGINAKGRKSRKIKKTVAVKVDTCSVDTFSYAMGMANTQGLKGYLATRLNVDTAYFSNFIEGFTATLSVDEQKKMQAYAAGIQIRQQVENQILPGLDKQITGNDSTSLLNRNLFFEGFRAAINNEKTAMDMNHAKDLVEKQMKYYHDSRMERLYGENRKAGEKFLKENAKKDSVETLPSGVQYKVLVKGNGEIPTVTSKVKVNYEGRLIDGTVFDSSYERKKPASFGCNQVIKGWTEALTHMPVGSKWEIYIPQELGYGAREAGKIKPFSALIFTVELLEIEK